MTNTNKPTKKINYAVLADMVHFAEDQGYDIPVENVTYESLYEFIDHQNELLANKAAAAQARAAEKKQAGDELREAVYNVLSHDEFMPVADIVAALGDPDITPNMVIARLTQLCSDEVGRVEKSSVTVQPVGDKGKARKVTTYRAI